jgi:hypothetical protein
MNSNIKKFLLAFIATVSLLFLSGCGGDGENGTSSQTNLLVDLGGTPLVGVPYDVTTHVNNTAIIDSHTVAPTNGETYTHTWTQIAGPTVAIANGNTAVATVTPAATGTVVLQHTVTNTTTGNATHTAHQVQVVGPPASMQVHTSYAVTVPGGLPTTFHASVAGGTAPYTYNWVQDTGIPLTLDVATNGFANPIVKLQLVLTDELIEYTLTVTDSTGLTDTAAVKFTILAVPPLHASIAKSSVVYSGISFQGAILECTAGGGVSPYTYSWGSSETVIDYTAQTGSYTAASTTNAHVNNVTFFCTVTDSAGSTKTVSTLITP